MSRDQEHDKKDQLWSAYLDGELSPSETLEYEQGLSANSKERFVAEQRVESALQEVLVDAPECPEGLWRELQTRLAAGDSMPTRRRLWKSVGLAVAAAVIFLLVLVPVLTSRLPGEALDGMELIARVVPVDEMEDVIQVGGDVAEVSRFLSDRGIALNVLPVETLSPRDAGEHVTRLVGARELQVGSEIMIELMWNCCGEPVVMKIMQQGGLVAASLLKDVGARSIIGMGQAGGHWVAIMGAHAEPGFITLIEPADPHV